MIENKPKEKRKRLIIGNTIPEPNPDYSFINLGEKKGFNKPVMPPRPKPSLSSQGYEPLPSEEPPPPPPNNKNYEEPPPPPPPNNNNYEEPPPPPPLPPSNNEDDGGGEKYKRKGKAEPALPPAGRKLVMGVGRENRSTVDVSRGLGDAITREKPFGKGIKKADKVALLEELQNMYSDGDKVRDFADVDKKVKEFLKDFDEGGPLKTAIKGYDEDLTATHWTVYLDNLFTALEGMGNPLKKRTSLRGTKITAKKPRERNSKRNTRKLRR